MSIRPIRAIRVPAFPARLRLAGLFAALLALFALLPHPASARPAAASLEAYWQLVDKTQFLVNRLADHPENDGRVGLNALADEWEALTQVTLPDGAVIALDQRAFAAALRADPPDLPRLKAHLEALQAARADWSSRIFRAGDTDSLRAILARSEYQWPEEQPSALEQWLNDLWERFLDWLSRMIGGDVFVGQDALYAIGGAIAVAAIIIFVLRHLYRDFVAEAEAAKQASEDERLSSQAALQRAQTLSASGDYRSAVRYLYLSALLLLDERGLLRYDRARTNHEVLRSVSHLPALAVPLGEVVDVFDRVWYGFEPLDEASFNHYASRVGELSQPQ